MSGAALGADAEEATGSSGAAAAAAAAPREPTSAQTSGSKQAWVSTDEADNTRMPPQQTLNFSQASTSKAELQPPAASHAKGPPASLQSAPPETLGSTLNSFRVLRHDGTLSLADVGTWGPVMVPVFLSALTIMAVAILFLALGPGDDEEFTWSARWDVAFITVLFATGIFGVTLYALQWWAHHRNDRDLPWGRWFRGVVRYLQVNAITAVMLLLVAHSPVALSQILSVLGATCWTLFCMSITAKAWRYGVKVPPHGDPPLLLWLRIACPTLLLFGAFLVSEGLALIVLFAKDLGKSGLDTSITRMEHWLLICLGALPVSSLVWTFLLALWPPFRRCLAFRYVPARRSYEDSPGILVAFARGFILSLSVHFFAAAFIFLLWYAVVTLIVILLTQAALWGARRRTQDNLTQFVNTRRMSSTSEDDNSPRSPGSRATQGSEGIVAVSEAPTTTDSERKRTPPQGRRESSQKKKVRQEETTLGKIKSHATDIGLVLFGLVKILGLFLIFLFDVSFVQKYMSSTVSRTYVWVAQDQVCGTAIADAEMSVGSVEECSRITIELGGSAFAYGRTAVYSELCWAYSLEYTLSRSAYQDLSSGTISATCADSDSSFESISGVDFYFLEPAKECDPLTDNLRRRLERPDAEDDGERKLQLEETAYNKDSQSEFFAPNEIGAAARDLWSGIGLDGFGRAVQRFITFCQSIFKWLLRLTPDVPGAFNLKCTGLRRLGAALILLGCVGAVGALASLDIMSVVQASKQLALARGAGHGSFLQYVLLLGFETGIEQCILLLLQVTISSGSSVKHEALSVWKQECGVFVEESNFAGGDCPNVWHIPVDGLAVGLIFAALLAALLIILAVFSGCFYGLPPARWAILTLFGKDFHLSQFGGHDQTMARTGRHPAGGAQASWARRAVQPFMGFPVSLGIWTTWTSAGYQIGRRQDWYQPIEVKASGEEEELGETDLVTWKCMYASTAKQISLAWLPLPYIGGIMAKGVLYLNECIVFAFGRDGGGARNEQEPIRHHVLEDRPAGLHAVHWATYAAQFVIILLINFDFFGMDREQRLFALGVCIVAVIVFAVLRVILDIIEMLLVFVQADKLLHAVTNVVHRGDVEEVSRHAKEGGGRDPLQGLNHEERTRVVQACFDLMELEWVQARILPAAQRNHLTSDRIRTITMARVVLKMQRAALHKRDPLKGADTLVKCASLLLLRDLSEHELQSKRADRAAKNALFQTLRRELEAAMDTDSSELCKLAKERAQQEVAVEAKKWHVAYAKAVKEFNENVQTGIFSEKPPAPPRAVRLNFSATSDMSLSIKGLWKVNSQLLAQPQEGKVRVHIRGEVEMKWPETEEDSCEPEQATVVTCEVELDVQKPSRFPSPDDSRDESVMVPRPSEQPLAIVDEEMGPTFSRGLYHFEQKVKDAKPTLLFSCFRKSAAADDAEGAAPDDEKWILHTSGPTWQAPPTGGEVLWSDSMGDENVSLRWSGKVEQQQTVTRDKVENLELTPEVLNKLEGILQAAPVSAEWLLDNFFGAIGGPGLQDLSSTQAAKRERLLLEAAKIMSRKRRGEGGAVPSGKADNPVQRRIYALEYLRMQLTSEPPSADGLSLAIDMGRRAGVDRALLAKGEETLQQLGKKGNQETQMIADDPSSEIPRELTMALSGSLSRPGVQENKKAGEQKRRLAVLKLALATDNADLLRRCMDEMESNGEGTETVHELVAAKQRLRILEHLSSPAEASRAASPASPAAAAPGGESLEDASPSTVTRNNTARALNDAKQFRAAAALRAAAFQDPVDVEVLRLAIDRAEEAGVRGANLTEAKRVLTAQEEHASSLERVSLAAARDNGDDLKEAVAQCRTSQVDSRQLLSLVAELIEECATIARRTDDHGQGINILPVLEAEHKKLLDVVQDATSNLRVVCRLRQGEAVLNQTSDSGESAQASASVYRVDRSTVAVASADNKEQAFKCSSVFGPSAIQAEIYSDVCNVVEPVLCGKNAAILACGPRGAGKTFSMMGGTVDARGMAPRILEEIFRLRERDDWRYRLDVCLQAFQIPDSTGLIDLLERPSKVTGTLRRRLQVRSGMEVTLPPGSFPPSPISSPSRSGLPVVVGSIQRQVESKHEARSFIDEASSNMVLGEWPPHVLFVVDLCRINRATRTMTKSRLILADMAALDTQAPDVVQASYECLRAVFAAVGDKQQSMLVPFASHPLTQILEGCVGSGSKVVMLMPLPTTDREASLHALNFGVRAGGVSVSSQRRAR